MSRRKAEEKGEGAASTECSATPPFRATGDSWISEHAAASPLPSPSASPLPRLLSKRSSRIALAGVSASSRSNGSLGGGGSGGKSKISNSDSAAAFVPAFADAGIDERAPRGPALHVSANLSSGSSSIGSSTLPIRVAAAPRELGAAEAEKEDEKREEGGEGRGGEQKGGARGGRGEREEEGRGRESFAERTGGTAVGGEAGAAPRAEGVENKREPPFGTSTANSSNSNDDDGNANGGTGAKAAGAATGGLRQRWTARSMLSPSGATSSDGLPSPDLATSRALMSARPAAVSFPPPQAPFVRRWSVDGSRRRGGRGGEETPRKRRPVMISFSASSDGDNDTDDGS